MIRATTPMISLTINDIDLTRAKAVYVTIRQREKEVTLTGDKLNVTSTTEYGSSVTKIVFHLSQASSVGLFPGNAKIQVNWIYTEDEEDLRGATKSKVFFIGEQLLPRVVTA